MTSRRLDWGGGGWVVLLGAVMVLAAGAWRVSSWLDSEGGAIGDGRDPASYGFDLEGLSPAVAATLIGSGLARDEMPALSSPPTMLPGELLAFNAAHRGKYVVDDDWVIGVTIAGESRAYPLRLLNWHEVVNDRLGDEPIAVTFHPLCDSVAVYSRRLDGVELVLGVSGLLYDSNVLFFDRRDPAGTESLWSQLTGAAISGPAAREGRQLTALPASLTRWRDWLEARPGTTIAAPDEDKLKRYQKNPYGGYLLTGKLRFPVDPLPAEEVDAMAPSFLLGSGATARVVGDVRAIDEALAVSREATIGRVGVLLTPEATTPLRYARRFAVDAQLADRR